MLTPLKSNWDYSLMICRRCGKRQDGGFGKKGKTKLAKLLRKAFHVHKNRKAKVGIVEVSCLNVCPANAVVMIDSRFPREWTLVKPGTPAEDIIADLDARAAD